MMLSVTFTGLTVLSLSNQKKRTSLGLVLAIHILENARYGGFYVYSSRFLFALSSNSSSEQ